MLMAVKTDKVANALAAKASKGEVERVDTVFDLIKRQGPAFQAALPKQISAERFSRIAMTAVRNNPALQNCNPMSFIAALMQSAQLGLEPNTPLGQAYIIPYGSEAQFQIGYQGLLTLAYRTGEYKTIYAHPVYAQDEFTYEYGLEESLVHKPSPEPSGAPIAYYAVYRLVNGGYGFAVMSRKEVEQHRDRFSPSWKKGRSPWGTDFDSMALKTVLKKCLKYAPKSVEFAAAISADETVKLDIAPDMSEVPTVEAESVTEASTENQTVDADADFVKGLGDENELPLKPL